MTHEHLASQNVISLLNELIAICRDGEEGYQIAAESIKEEHYRSLFLQYAVQRRNFMTALQDEVVRLGGKPEDDGDLAGTLHRTWINLKGALTGNGIDAVLVECEKGDAAALEVYAEAKKKNLPADVHAIVDDQYLAIKAAHDRIRALIDER